MRVLFILISLVGAVAAAAVSNRTVAAGFTNTTVAGFPNKTVASFPNRTAVDLSDKTAVVATNKTASTHCYSRWHPSNMVFVRKWIVIASHVDDIPTRCGGFWDNMKNPNFHSACTLMETNCGEDDNGDMVINFSAFIGCNGGHVESAWWEATKHTFGDLDCS